MEIFRSPKNQCQPKISLMSAIKIFNSSVSKLNPSKIISPWSTEFPEKNCHNVYSMALQEISKESIENNLLGMFLFETIESFTSNLPPLNLDQFNLRKTQKKSVEFQNILIPLFRQFFRMLCFVDCRCL